jgi:hypothetical protein
MKARWFPAAAVLIATGALALAAYTGGGSMSVEKRVGDTAAADVRPEGPWSTATFALG